MRACLPLHPVLSSVVGCCYWSGSRGLDLHYTLIHFWTTLLGFEWIMGRISRFMDMLVALSGWGSEGAKNGHRMWSGYNTNRRMAEWSVETHLPHTLTNFLIGEFDQNNDQPKVRRYVGTFEPRVELSWAKKRALSINVARIKPTEAREQEVTSRSGRRNWSLRGRLNLRNHHNGFGS